METSDSGQSLLLLLKCKFKETFSDKMWMERLLNVLRGDAKRSVETISKSKVLYASALKSLKWNFGNALCVSHTELSELFDKP